jgi:hypothetical protein
METGEGKAGERIVRKVKVNQQDTIGKGAVQGVNDRRDEPVGGNVVAGYRLEQE